MTSNPNKHAALWKHLNSKTNSFTIKEHTFPFSNFNTHLPAGMGSTGLSICSWLQKGSRTAYSPRLLSPGRGQALHKPLPQLASDNLKAVNQRLGQSLPAARDRWAAELPAPQAGIEHTDLPLHNRI